MENIVSINQRGVLTLPKDIRVRYGLEEGGQIVVEETDDGILLRPAITFPIESYSDERVKEFENNNEEALAAFKLP
jgi:AbrB family looped-hinge helix DNA binding protein